MLCSELDVYKRQEQYCAAHGYTLLKIYRDVISGGKDQRPGLGAALEQLQNSADILIAVSYTHLDVYKRQVSSFWL